MGSPLAPVLANLLLGQYENLWLNKYRGPSIHFYRRYVDDTFCLSDNEHDSLLFFEYLNSQQPAIKFTMEKEMNNTLAFLDVRIDNEIPSGLVTSVYCKLTFTGLLTNFVSFTSFSYKLGLIRTLLDRAYKINNTLSGFNEEVKSLYHIFQKNQFPEGMINKAVKTYLDSVSNSENYAADSTTSSNDICILYSLYYLSFKSKNLINVNLHLMIVQAT